MNHTFFTRSKLKECTKLFDADNLTYVNLSLFELAYNDINQLFSLVHHCLISTADRYGTVIGNIDLHAGLLDDCVDGLTSLANYITDLLRVNAHLDDLRSVLAYLFSRLSDARLHAVIHDEESCLTASCNSTLYDRSGQSMDLDIHLDSRDTVSRTSYLEVHVAEEVFQTLDIGQKYEIIVSLTSYQTAGNTCYHLLDRHTCCHQGHTGCTGRSHGSGTVGLKGLGYTADCIRELFLTRQYRNQSSLSQCTMTDLTTSRSSGRFGLSYRVAREVVMMHVSLAYFMLIQSIQLLLLRQRSQRTYVTDLSLSTGEHSGTMYSRDNIYFSCQRTNLGDLTSIRTFVIFQDHLADSLLLILIYSFTKNSKPLLILCKSLFQLLSQDTDILLTGLLVIGKYSLLHLFLRNDLFDGCKQLFRNCTAGVSMFLFANLCYDLIDKFDDGLVYFMSFVNSLNHFCFRNLICSGLNHDHFLTGRSNGQVQITFLPLLLGRVDDKLTINHAHLSHGTGSCKGNVRNAGCDCSTKHGNKLRTAGRIYAHNHIVQGNVISVILREQRTHRTVNHTGSQDGILRCFSLSLIESSRDFSYRI